MYKVVLLSYNLILGAMHMKSEVEKGEFAANFAKLKNKNLPLYERVLAYTSAFFVADDNERKRILIELDIAAMEIRDAEVNK
jgi:hypothetical protein